MFKIKNGKFQTSSELIFSAPNFSDNWLKWKQKFENLILASEKNGKKDKIKIAILLNVISDECIIIFNDGESKEKFDDAVKKFENHCLPLSNEVFECFKFLSCSQKDRQAIDVYDVCTEP